MSFRSLLFAHFLLTSFFASTVFAADLEWSGTYRAEGVFIKNSEASSSGKEKSYGLHHLILKPKIVASDGLTIYSQLHLFNTSANSGLMNSQMGQFFGSGPQSGAASSAHDSDTLSDQGKSESLLVSQLYLSMAQEYGGLVVGRVPLQFGLGMTHNAGNGLFDHWFDSRDVVGYKVIMGNLWFMPMIGKKYEGTLNANDDVSSYIVQVQYDNFETNISMGAMYEVNKANDQAPTGPTASFPGAAAGQKASLDEEQWNIFALKETETLRFGLEAAFQSGQNGLRDASGNGIEWDGFGVAVEFEYRPEGSLWNYGFDGGYASGDDPATSSKYEGYVFDRNYDVAFLMFNHQLGQADFLGTSGFGGGGTTLASGGNQQPDVEAIANVMYFSPFSRYKWSDKWTLGARVTAGWLAQNPLSGHDVKKGLGYELDLALEYSPKKGVRWVNEFGYLMSGDTFKGGSQFDSSDVFGFSTKAAISF